MRGQLVWILAGFCFSFGASPTIAQADTAVATVTANSYSTSVINSNNIANNGHNERSLESEATPPATTVAEWAEQIAQSLVQITAVKLNKTEAGIELVLQTAQGEPIAPTTRTVGNAVIADIPNAMLSNGEFSQANPTEGIALVNVTSLPGDRVRVAITGTATPPTVQISSTAQQLVMSVAIGTTAGQGEEELQVVVTGEQGEGYNPSESTTATRTGTPLRDIPQSIQVVPRQVIEDQGITRITDAVQNVSGATIQSGFGNLFSDINLRGFTNSNVLRDGFVGQPAFIDSANIERVEVLKGPASVLYGQLEPGGVVNYVTEQPLRQPYYSAELQAGSYSFYRPSIDLSGPLTADGRLLYRLNASYENSGSYRNFIDNDVFFISPVVTYALDETTTLNLAYEYLEAENGFDRGFGPFSVYLDSDIPRDRNIGGPDDFINTQSHRASVILNHEFNRNLRLRSGFSALITQEQNAYFNIGGEPNANGILERGAITNDRYQEDLRLQTDLIGEFNTGSIVHQLLAGLELSRSYQNNSIADGSASSINIFDPDYENARFDISRYRDFEDRTNTLGIYLQDQVTLLPNLRLLIGGRYDSVRFNNDTTITTDTVSTSDSEFQDDAFSPRVGIVYQPIEPLSLYASYSRSFVPNNSLDASGNLLAPSRGTQYEVGAKAQLGNLSATLAAYEITKTNVPTTDPNNIDFSIAAGEVTSRGLEFDLSGELSLGWNVIASAFLNDAFISRDNSPTLNGKQQTNAPETGASLWTTYTIQRGSLHGLGFGAGIFYAGDQFANQEDLFNLPSYVRVDAAIYYQRDDWRVALNFKNLFDVEYYQSNGYLVFPQAPFTVLGSISFRF